MSLKMVRGALRRLALRSQVPSSRWQQHPKNLILALENRGFEGVASNQVDNWGAET